MTDTTVQQLLAPARTNQTMTIDPDRLKIYHGQTGYHSFLSSNLTLTQTKLDTSGIIATGKLSTQGHNEQLPADVIVFGQQTDKVKQIRIEVKEAKAEGTGLAVHPLMKTLLEKVPGTAGLIQGKIETYCDIPGKSSFTTASALCQIKELESIRHGLTVSLTCSESENEPDFSVITGELIFPAREDSWRAGRNKPGSSTLAELAEWIGMKDQKVRDVLGDATVKSVSLTITSNGYTEFALKGNCTLFEQPFDCTITIGVSESVNAQGGTTHTYSVGGSLSTRVNNHDLTCGLRYDQAAKSLVLTGSFTQAMTLTGGDGLHALPYLGNVKAHGDKDLWSHVPEELKTAGNGRRGISVNEVTFAFDLQQTPRLDTFLVDVSYDANWVIDPFTLKEIRLRFIGVHRTQKWTFNTFLSASSTLSGIELDVSASFPEGKFTLNAADPYALAATTVDKLGHLNTPGVRLERLAASYEMKAKKYSFDCALLTGLTVPNPTDEAKTLFSLSGVRLTVEGGQGTFTASMSATMAVAGAPTRVQATYTKGGGWVLNASIGHFDTSSLNNWLKHEFGHGLPEVLRELEIDDADLVYRTNPKGLSVTIHGSTEISDRDARFSIAIDAAAGGDKTFNGTLELESDNGQAMEFNVDGESSEDGKSFKATWEGKAPLSGLIPADAREELPDLSHLTLNAAAIDFHADGTSAMAVTGIGFELVLASAPVG